MEEKKDDTAVNALVSTGSEISGAAIGAGIGFATGGPIGAIAGSALSPLFSRIIEHIAKEFRSRALADREEAKVGASLSFALHKIKKNFSEGQYLRQDSFFEESLYGRSSAAEILEGIMLAAQREHEEKKLKYYGNLIANVAFQPEVTKEQANLLIKLSEGLTYRQLCILSLVASKNSYHLRAENLAGKDDNGRPFSMLTNIEEIFILQEISDLQINRTLDFSSDIVIGRSLGGLEHIRPQTIEFMPIGKQLYNLMELSDIPDQDIYSLAQVLS